MRAYSRSVTTTSDSARLEFDRAVACDRAGREEEAIPHYEAALRLGLADDLVPGAMLGLGSSLRNVGRADEAVELLVEACARFPDDAALSLFHALALSTAGRCEEAFASVFRLAATRIDTAEVVRYRRALDEYAAELER
jgi:Flp pilus assembly protein TadD